MKPPACLSFQRVKTIEEESLQKLSHAIFCIFSKKLFKKICAGLQPYQIQESILSTFLWVFKKNMSKKIFLLTEKLFSRRLLLNYQLLRSINQLLKTTSIKISATKKSIRKTNIFIWSLLKNTHNFTFKNIRSECKRKTWSNFWIYCPKLFHFHV